MSRFPELKFVVSRKAEKETALFFLRGDSSFFDRFVRDFPELNKVKDEKLICKKIDEYYNLREKELIDRIPLIKQNWDKIKDEFFALSEKIFDGFKWNNKEIVVNISLFGMFRLVPWKRRFSIPFKDEPAGYINSTIAHEMMHILFEDFYKENFGKPKDKQRYFDFMEIVNCVVLNLPEVQNLIKWKTEPYPQHKEGYLRLKELYKKCSPMKGFLKRKINYLNKK